MYTNNIYVYKQIYINYFRNMIYKIRKLNLSNLYNRYYVIYIYHEITFTITYLCL